VLQTPLRHRDEDHQCIAARPQTAGSQPVPRSRNPAAGGGNWSQETDTTDAAELSQAAISPINGKLHLNAARTEGRISGDAVATNPQGPPVYML
jgi:hypothetical protein